MRARNSLTDDPKRLLAQAADDMRLRASRRLLPNLLRQLEQARTDREAADARMNNFAETIRILIGMLPDTERADFQRRVDDIRSGVRQNRGGELYGNVIALFRRDQRPEWTVPEAQAALAQNGVKADAKALNNTFVYLANTGRLQRVARGRYVVTGYGVGVETSDELTGDDGTQRVSEHDV
jgi:hypothetical protein